MSFVIKTNCGWSLVPRQNISFFLPLNPMSFFSLQDQAYGWYEGVPVKCWDRAVEHQWQEKMDETSNLNELRGE